MVGDFYEKNASLLDQYIASTGTRLKNNRVNGALTDAGAANAGKAAADRANLTANGITGKAGTLKLGYGG